MFIGPCIIVIVEEWKTNLMSLAILFNFLCAQHVSDINISIIRSLRLCCWITTSVVLFSVRCVLEIWCCWFWVVLSTQNQQHQSSNTQRNENKTTDVVIQQHSRKLLMKDTLMSETCWAHKKWNKIASAIKLVFHSWKVRFKYEQYFWVTGLTGHKYLSSICCQNIISLCSVSLIPVLRPCRRMGFLNFWSQ